MGCRATILCIAKSLSCRPWLFVQNLPLRRCPEPRLRGSQLSYRQRASNLEPKFETPAICRDIRGKVPRNSKLSCSLDLEWVTATATGMLVSRFIYFWFDLSLFL